MRSIDILQNLLQDESRRREQIRAHLRAALALLDAAEESPATIPAPPVVATTLASPSPVMVTPTSPAPATPIPPQSVSATGAAVVREKRQYIERMVTILERSGRPLGPAELRDEVCRDLPSTTREALERAIWLELRKNNPRLARLGEGKYGLPEWRYKWITDGTTA